MALDKISKFLFSPKQVFEKILIDEEFNISKRHFVFLLLMNIYYVFVPSIFIMVNILAPIFIMLSIGVMYHFANRAMFVYREHSMSALHDNKFFYRVALCFALANIPAFVYLVGANIFSFVINEEPMTGLFLAYLLNFPGIFIAAIYPLHAMAVITRRKNNLFFMIRIWIESCMQTIREFLGLKVVKQVWADFRSA